MRNIRLLLQYEGTRYQGWQRQTSTDNTIQGKLELLLSRMCGEEIELQGSGRTDAGVHAMGQVANFHTACTMSVEDMTAYINRYLPEDIALLALQEAAPRFHSRLNAKGKCYVYRVDNGTVCDVFWRRYAYHVPEPLDLEQMRRAAERLIGTHDFQSFTSARKGKKSTLRRLDEIRIDRQGQQLVFTFTGDGFLYHMVRILMGTLLEVGMGRRSAESVEEILAAQSRQTAGPLAPAKGLMLQQVFYD